jgi:hypothetical protein
MYLVLNSYSNCSAFDMQSFKLFKNYEDAKKYFEEEKQKIKSFDLGYDEIQDEENLYCESINGEYIYNHELVQIIELEVN